MERVYVALDDSCRVHFQDFEAVSLENGVFDAFAALKIALLAVGDFQAVVGACQFEGYIDSPQSYNRIKFEDTELEIEAYFSFVLIERK